MPVLRSAKDPGNLYYFFVIISKSTTTLATVAIHTFMTDIESMDPLCLTA